MHLFHRIGNDVCAADAASGGEATEHTRTGIAEDSDIAPPPAYGNDGSGLTMMTLHRTALFRIGREAGARSAFVFEMSAWFRGSRA